MLDNTIKNDNKKPISKRLINKITLKACSILGLDYINHIYSFHDNVTLNTSFKSDNLLNYYKAINFKNVNTKDLVFKMKIDKPFLFNLINNNDDEINKLFKLNNRLEKLIFIIGHELGHAFLYKNNFIMAYNYHLNNSKNRKKYKSYRKLPDEFKADKIGYYIVKQLRNENFYGLLK